MKKLTSLLLLALMCQIATAKQISQQQAAAIAGKYVPTIKAANLKPAKKAGATEASSEYYVFDAAGGGFAVVAGDDEFDELIGYSTTGRFGDIDQLPTALKDGLNNYAEYVRRFRAGEVPAIKNKLTASSVVVSPLVTTKWNQEEPYNNNCPYSTRTGENCPTGCAATAMAQIMNYYEWPQTGEGSNSYSDSFGTHSVNFAQSTYDWNNMLDSYDSYNATQAAAVAKLMWDCGVAMYMEYTVNGSGAIDGDMALAAADHFKYNTQILYRDGSFKNQFRDAILASLDAHDPIILCGQGSMGGHAFVADGYNSANYLHINWGWGGMSDGYFNIDALNPPALGTGGGAGGFNMMQSAILMTPTANNSTSGSLEQMPLLLYDTRYSTTNVGYFKATTTAATKGSAFKVSTVYLFNNATGDWSGAIAAGVYTEDGELLGISSTKTITIKDGYLYSNTTTFDVGPVLATLNDGEYVVKAVSRESRSGVGVNDWLPVSTPERVVVAVDGDQVYVGNKPVEIELTAPITSDKETYDIGDTAIFTASIENKSDEAAQGTLKFLISDAESGAKKMTATSTISLTAGATGTASIKISISSSRFQVGKSYTISITDYTPTTGSHIFKAADGASTCTIAINDPDKDGGVGSIAAQSVKVFPNPATEIIKVSGDGVKSIELYSASGAKVRRAEGNTMNIADLPSGYYLISVATQNGTVTHRIIKK